MNFVHVAKTNGIKVSIEPEYSPEFSNVASKDYMFRYKVEIINENDFPVRIAARHWDINDADVAYKRVAEGAGVMAHQPVIRAGNNYNYESGAIIRSEVGELSGYYLVNNMNTGELLRVEIPHVLLQTPMVLN